MCCDSWGRKESDMTERLKQTEMFLNRELIMYFAKCIFCFIGIILQGFLFSQLIELTFKH